MECEEVRDQFADYLIDNLQEPARLEVRNHLAACESCRSEAEGLETLWTKLGTIPAAEPGPELRARFQVMLEAYRHGLDQAPSRSFRQSMNEWLVLLVVGVAAGWRLRPEPVVQPNGEITELRGELRQMRQMVALSLMQQQSASERLKGVNWSYQLQQPDREVLTALLDTLMHDPNVNVRLAAIDALRQFGGQPVVRSGVVEALGRQDSPMVQVALIDLVVDLKEKESVDTLRKLIQNEKLNEAVRTRAQKGLQELE